MMAAMAEGSIRGLYVMGEDIVMSEPNATKVEKGLNQCEFLVVQDIFTTETLRYADVVLPAACFAEKDGVFTNSDRRVQRVRKAVEPPGEARADWKILCDVSRAAGYAMPHYENAEQVYAEMASLSPKFAGISHARLETENLHWPCEGPDDPGTPTLHRDGPIRGKAPFQAISYRPSAELADVEYPLVLSTGRTLYHYNVATQTRRDAGPVALQPECFVQMHRYDARQLGLAHGERVRVSSRRGELECLVEISKQVRVGCVWMPFHFAEAPTNKLTNDAGDSVTGTGEYKVCAVRVEAT
jgi:formate dehydrogenase major subunit/formate dehydrogenase alpha subunit